MSCDTLVDPSLPRVLLGDTVETPPLECYVLFECPLTTKRVTVIYIP